MSFNSTKVDFARENQTWGTERRKKVLHSSENKTFFRLTVPHYFDIPDGFQCYYHDKDIWLEMVSSQHSGGGAIMICVLFYSLETWSFRLCRAVKLQLDMCRCCGGHPSSYVCVEFFSRFTSTFQSSFSKHWHQACSNRFLRYSLLSPFWRRTEESHGRIVLKPLGYYSKMCLPEPKDILCALILEQQCFISATRTFCETHTAMTASNSGRVTEAAVNDMTEAR